MSEFKSANTTDVLIEYLERIANALCGESEDPIQGDRLRDALRRIAEHYESNGSADTEDPGTESNGSTTTEDPGTENNGSTTTEDPGTENNGSTGTEDPETQGETTNP